MWKSQDLYAKNIIDLDVDVSDSNVVSRTRAELETCSPSSRQELLHSTTLTCSSKPRISGCNETPPDKDGGPRQ